MSNKHAPCWILSNPRTGSNYLADALNQTGTFDPEFREWLNPIPPTQRDHFHVRWPSWHNIKEPDSKKRVDQFLRNLPRFMKIHSFDYQLFFDWHHKPAVEEHLPGIKFIRLRRMDLIATTVSYYLATTTGVFATADSEVVRQHKKIQVPIDVEKLLQFYRWTIEWDEAWDNFLAGTPHLELWYEELVTNRAVIEKVFDYLNLPIGRARKIVPQIKKLQHPQTEQLIETLKENLNVRSG